MGLGMDAIEEEEVYIYGYCFREAGSVRVGGSGKNTTNIVLNC